jgi:hypothetical protein
MYITGSETLCESDTYIMVLCSEMFRKCSEIAIIYTEENIRTLKIIVHIFHTRHTDSLVALQ